VYCFRSGDTVFGSDPVEKFPRPSCYFTASTATAGCAVASLHFFVKTLFVPLKVFPPSIPCPLPRPRGLDCFSEVRAYFSNGPFQHCERSSPFSPLLWFALNLLAIWIRFHGRVCRYRNERRGQVRPFLLNNVFPDVDRCGLSPFLFLSTLLNP